MTGMGPNPPVPDAVAPAIDRHYLLERVGDAAVVQLYADGFVDLSRRDKILIWHLTRAAIAGRDIFYDQRYAHNLEMRDVLEGILTHSTDVDRETLREVERYTKLFWINTGPYNNLTARKFVLACTPDAFAAAAHAAARRGASFPLRDGETLDRLLSRLRPMFFDVTVDQLVTNKTPASGGDLLLASANNLYVGVTMRDLDGFAERHPLNSRLVKRDGSLVEEVYRVDGRYGRQLQAVVEHLEAAIPYATDPMADALRSLITFYRTGETSDRDAYDIAWVQDKESPVDTINGFVEVYLDARSMKGAWEALVFYVNREKTFQIRTIAENAQWFEDRMPWDSKYRKAGVRGVTANAIDVVIETGDSGPITPVGINLPNDQAIREQYGSKSVSLSNVNEAYDRSTPPELRREFCWSAEEFERAQRWASFASELTTNLHEVIGHGSGKVAGAFARQSAVSSQRAVFRNRRITCGSGGALLRRRSSAGRARLAGRRRPDGDRSRRIRSYARNALVQLRRVREGTTIEEDHMRNRQMIVHWLMANTNAIEVRMRGGKTYYVMTRVAAFREGVGRLLAEVQRIKGEETTTAARALVETYGVHFDSGSA
jgi:dipeptidyl-peptidase-3